MTRGMQRLDVSGRLVRVSGVTLSHSRPGQVGNRGDLAARRFTSRIVAPPTTAAQGGISKPVQSGFKDDAYRNPSLIHERHHDGEFAVLARNRACRR